MEGLLRRQLLKKAMNLQTILAGMLVKNWNDPGIRSVISKDFIDRNLHISTIQYNQSNS